jgi:two-component system chemotaxis sensor kinase CheA
MSDLVSASSLSSRPLGISIHSLRRLILAVLTFSVLGFTGGVFVLLQRIFDNFGPAIERDLSWKTLHGAKELAAATDLGLAVDDGRLVTEGFGEFRRIEDVIAIVAVNATGRLVATHGAAPESAASLLSGPPATVRATPGYLVAWTAAVVEGNTVGRIAVVMSTRRIIESRRLLRNISWATAGAGLVALLCGLLFVNFFTRSIAERDAQLAAYAAGLENKVAERTAQLAGANQGMRLVLDNVEQGFLAVSLDGVMVPERSRILDRWFGPAVPDMTLAQYLRPIDGDTADWIAIGLQALIDDVLPRELVLDQLPKRVVRGEQTFALAYVPVAPVGDHAFDRLLVVITDRTAELAREKVERESHEIVELFQHVVADRAGVDEFLIEAGDLVRQVVTGASPQVDERRLHTLKGNCALFGIGSVSRICHEIEDRLRDGGDHQLTEVERERLRAQWERVSILACTMKGERPSVVDLAEADLADLQHALKTRAPHEQIAAIVESWRNEKVVVRFGRLAEKTQYLAKRLGKPALRVHIDGPGVRLAADRWAPFWTALVHAISNAVDHGIEDPELRLAQGKPAAGTLWLAARWEARDLVLSIKDDGRGIDWTALAASAAAKGLPHTTHADLIDALFSDGVSTRANATTTSGRGIGLAALREATAALGGRITVTSEAGRGAALEFRFAHTPAPGPHPVNEVRPVSA